MSRSWQSPNSVPTKWNEGSAGSIKWGFGRFMCPVQGEGTTCQGLTFLYLYPHPNAQSWAVNLSPPPDGEHLVGLWLFHLCIPSAGFSAGIQWMFPGSVWEEVLPALNRMPYHALLWPGWNHLRALPAFALIPWSASNLLTTNFISQGLCYQGGNTLVKCCVFWLWHAGSQARLLWE